MTCEKTIDVAGLGNIVKVCGGEIQAKGEFMDANGNWLQLQQCEKCKNIELV